MATRTGGSASKGNGNRGGAVPPRTGYDQVKEFQGKRYTGMKVGRRHKWRYEPGEWNETKVTPDKWEFRYAVTKRRAGHAPEGSGAPVGTAYHWYILAHQTVTKLDANSYSTDMAGVKYKLAHQRAEKGTWNASDKAQRKRLIQILQEMIADLEKQGEEPATTPSATPAAATAPAKAAPPADREATAKKATPARKPPRRRNGHKRLAA
jgi:hypothetical protein